MLRGHGGGVVCLAVLSAAGLLVSGSLDRTARVWDLATGGSPVMTLEGHKDSVRAAVGLPDGRVATASHDKTVRLWTIPPRAPKPAPLPASPPPTAAQLTFQSRAMEEAGKVTPAAASAARARTEVLQHDGEVNALALVEGGARLLAACADYQVYVWAFKPGAPSLLDAQLHGHSNRVTALVALPGGLFASGSDDTTVRVWDLASLTCVSVLKGHAGGVHHPAALPGGRVASADIKAGGRVRVWTLCKPGSEEDVAAALLSAEERVVEPSAEATGPPASGKK